MTLILDEKYTLPNHYVECHFPKKLYLKVIRWKTVCRWSLPITSGSLAGSYFVLTNTISQSSWRGKWRRGTTSSLLTQFQSQVGGASGGGELLRPNSHNFRVKLEGQVEAGSYLVLTHTTSCNFVNESDLPVTPVPVKSDGKLSPAAA